MLSHLHVYIFVQTYRHDALSLCNCLVVMCVDTWIFKSVLGTPRPVYARNIHYTYLEDRDPCKKVFHDLGGDRRAPVYEVYRVVSQQASYSCMNRNWQSYKYEISDLSRGWKSPAPPRLQEFWAFDTSTGSNLLHETYL